MSVGIGLKVGGKVAKVAVQIARKVETSPTGRYCTQKIGRSWKHLKESSSKYLNRFSSWIKGSKATATEEQIAVKEAENAGKQIWTSTQKRNTFPRNSNDLLPDLPRDMKGRIYAADNDRCKA